MSRARPWSFARLTCALAMPAIVGLASARQEAFRLATNGARSQTARDP